MCYKTRFVLRLSSRPKGGSFDVFSAQNVKETYLRHVFSAGHSGLCLEEGNCVPPEKQFNLFAACAARFFGKLIRFPLMSGFLPFGRDSIRKICGQKKLLKI